MKRLKFLAKRYGHKVAAQYIANETKRKHQLEERIVNKIAELDPTKGKRYTQWLLHEYIAGEFDLKTINKSEVTERLMDFERYKVMMPSNDISTYNWRKLIKKLEPYQNVMGAETLSNKEVQRLYRQSLSDALEAHSWYENKQSKTKVIQLLSEEAAIYYGKGTRWCISARKNNEFENYAKLGDLFFIQFNGKKFLFQVAFHSQEVSISLADDADQILDLTKPRSYSFPFRNEDVEFGQILEVLLIWSFLKKGVSLRLSEGSLFEEELNNEFVVKGLSFDFAFKKLKNAASIIESSEERSYRKIYCIQFLEDIKLSFPEEIKYRVLPRLAINPPDYLFEELLIRYPFLTFMMNYKNREKLEELACKNPDTLSFKDFETN